MRLALLFDHRAWQEHHDVGDNSIFYRPVEIVREYTRIDGQKCVDVRWLGGSEISRSHFTSALKPWPEARP